MRAAMVPVGWMVGCPALGYLTDRIGRRKPVLLGGIVVMALTVAAILYLPGNTFPPYILAFVLAGVLTLFLHETGPGARSGG